MPTDTTQGRREAPWASAAFHCLLFTYPVLGFLWRRLYPLVAPEALLLLGGALLAGLLVALVLTQVRPAVGCLFSALLAAAVLTLQFDLRLEALLPVLVALPFAAVALGAKFHRYALPVLLVLIPGAWLDSRSDVAPRRAAADIPGTLSPLPPVVHIVFDAFEGPAGLPPGQASDVIRQDLHALFQAFGFRIHERAYSRHATTGDSLYAALNFSDRGDSEYLEEVKYRRGHEIRSSAYFDRLRALGYEFNVYQTGFLDFCRYLEDALASCWTYPQPNVLSLRYAGPATRRVRLLLGVLLAQSSLYRDLLPRLTNTAEFGIAVHDPRIFERLQQDLADQSRGRVFFAHVLLPHGPFAYAPDCSIDYSGRPWERNSGIKGEPVLPDAAYERRYVRYYRQVQCALESLHALLRGMRAAGILDDAFVLVHGDHGSLIGRHPPSVDRLGLLEPRDYRAHFSTLFAWKPVPGRFGVIDEAAPLSALLEDFVRQVEARVPGRRPSPLRVNPRDETPYVYLSGAHPRHRVDIDIFAAAEGD